ncbi:hypothetical protein ACFL0S_11735 [Thermodesulfobacteriota bacterium]
MAIIKTITPYISKNRMGRIEAHCRKIGSEEIVEGYIALVSTRMSRDNKIEIKPLRKDEGGEQTA